MLPARFAVLASACRSPRTVADLIGKLRVPQEAAQLARLLVELRDTLGDGGVFGADRRCARARRRVSPARTLRTAAADVRGRVPEVGRTLSQRTAAAAEVDAGALASLHRNDPAEIPRAVRQARVVAVSRALHAGTQEGDGAGSESSWRKRGRVAPR